MVKIKQPIPLMGSIAFGVIDRGTNVLQVRVTSVCSLCCSFCSVDAGPCSKRRWADYVIEDIEWLKNWIVEIIKIKGTEVEILLDGVGDPLEHPRIVDIVKHLKDTEGVNSVALETHGYRLTQEMVFRLDEAGLDRINLSLDTLDSKKARMLTSRPDYDVNRIKDTVEIAIKETKIDVHVTPVLLPEINEDDIKDIIRWAKEIGLGKRWPPFTVQKYVVHKRGRKMKGVREMSWNEFWRWIDNTERELGVRLRWSMDEWGMKKASKVPILYKRGERVKVEMIARGLFKGEWLAVPIPRRDVVMTVINTPGEIGKRVKVRIVSNKDNIYLAMP